MWLNHENQNVYYKRKIKEMKKMKYRDHGILWKPAWDFHSPTLSLSRFLESGAMEPYAAYDHWQVLPVCCCSARNASSID